ncbi:hypothetical protein [Flavobacterium branchiicola]|uniref:Lipoprotein n=1 Tax=Flavobacterium branchiicola TaxID=1114875 RepID=A0ABV9PC50_9FLAO|nr:hypothetical protein [Flavobacterium branchiicola]MBS7253627.1 hypothetical protein [Flavobacterium branchiicola]
MKSIYIFLVVIFFISCQQKETKNVPVSVADSITVNKNTGNLKENKEENRQKDDTIFMNYKDDKGVFIAEGIIDSIHSKIYLKFKNEDLGQLNATIIPATGKGNIRFNQIIFPDNTADGPFGTDLKIQLTQKGNYILVIGPSLMADSPYWGKFNVQLDVK